MAKKGLAVQLQIEVNNDDEWENLLQKDGLIVVDVYSEWCGPCTGMVATLKKIKLEMGGDTLHLAIAKAEGVTDLHRFIGKSEPTWMLIAKGKLVNFMFGANAPKLTQMIIDELKKEIEAMEGKRERVSYDIAEPTPPEKERLAKIEAEKRAEEERERRKIDEEIRERRTKECNGILENLSHFGVILVLPNAIKRYQEIVNDLLSEAGLNIFKTDKIYIKPEQLEELFYFGENIFNEETIDELANNESICMIVKPRHGHELLEEIEDVLLQSIYGEAKTPPGDVNSAARILSHTPLPAKLLKSLVQIRPDESFGEEDEEEEADMSKLAKDPFQVVTEYMDERREELEMEEEEEEEEKVALWTPLNRMIKAAALKLFATDIVENYILPIPEPTPPHFALIFDSFRRQEVAPIIEKYRKHILHYGFFTDTDPKKAELIAKTLRQFERSPFKSTDAKMVLQVSKKKSECLLALITLKPNYISPNEDEGKKQCRIFFPDEYYTDIEEEEEVEEEEDRNLDVFLDQTDGGYDDVAEYLGAEEDMYLEEQEDEATEQEDEESGEYEEEMDEMEA